MMYTNNNRPVHVAVPTPQMPVPNAYDDFVRAGKLVMGVKHKSPLSMPRPSFAFADFEAAAKDAQPALSVMRQGLQKEYLNPPIRTYGALPTFPVFATFRELARTESGTATYYEMDGKPGKATEARLDGLEMAVMIPRGGALIAGLVGIACEAIAVSQFEPQLPRLSESELAHVASRLDKIAAKRVPLADILQEEGYQQTLTDAGLMNDPKGYRNLDTLRNMLAEDTFTPQGTLQKAPLTLRQDWDVVRFILADKAAIIRDNQAYNEALVAEARKPYTGRSSVPVPRNLLAQMRGNIVSESRARFTAMEAVMALLRTEVALYRYKRAHGSFPGTLIALTPTYLLPETLIDPCAGTMLRYRLTQNGQAFLLYSIGPDMKDDSGSPSRFVGGTPGDIVAGHMWKHRTFKK